jgi:hypothetical protein
MVGKYKKIELVTDTNKFVASLMSMKIKHALLLPSVNSPTCVYSAYNTLKPENTLNWWGTFCAQVPFTFRPDCMNAMSKNNYTSVLPRHFINFFGVHQIGLYDTKSNEDFM